MSRSVPVPGPVIDRRWSALARRPVIWMLRTYQLVLSPLHPQSCRFYPSCSAYAVTAIERHGLLRGVALAGRRLLRCHPWNPGGVDHVPGTGGDTAAAPTGSG
jgi:putative membrane protein insertion efficiency factor